MKFGIFYELQLPRPWEQDNERQLYHNALDQLGLADRLGIDYAWEVEHHFLEEYSHCPNSTPARGFLLGGTLGPGMLRKATEWVFVPPSAKPLGPLN